MLPPPPPPPPLPMAAITVKQILDGTLPPLPPELPPGNHALQAKRCPCEVINPANGPTTFNDLFPEKSPCTCGQHVVAPPPPLPPDAYAVPLSSLAAPVVPLVCPAGTTQTVVVAQGPKINVRAKGQRGEREVVKLLQQVVDVVRAKHCLNPIVVQRNQNQSHLGGDDLTGLDRYAIEVKFQENESLPAWWRQCLSQAGGNQIPVLFYRASRSPWKVRFQGYVNTPGDRDQIEMDLDVSVEDFIEWFGSSYDEECAAAALAMAS